VFLLPYIFGLFVCFIIFGFFVPVVLLAHIPYVEKIKVGLCDLHAVCVSVNAPSPPRPLTFECLNQSL
jgi:hypothetical protein